MTTMIALVGDQPQPNFLPVLHYKPDNVLLVYTKKTKDKYNYLKVALEKRNFTIYGVETDPYDISSIVKALNEKLEDKSTLLSQSLLVNLTGGTKTMSLAAYQIAQQHNSPMMYLQSEGKQTRIYHYIWEKQLQLTESELLPEYLLLHDVFNLHFGPGNWQEHGSRRREGSVFEELLATTLRTHGYEVMVGVQAMGGQIDVDIALRLGNQYGIIEAKMGENGRKLDGIKQLSIAARHLGTYSQTFYAITVPPNSSHIAITEASNIEVISLSSYNSTTHSLSPSDVTELISKVDKKLKG